MSPTAPRLTFPRALRLSGERAFEAVFAAKLRRGVGPLTIYTRPNGLPHHRLGLSVSRRVGNAVVRNLVKRRLREAFRLLQHELPGAYDIVVTVRPHDAAPLERHRSWLEEAVRGLHAAWQRRGAPPDPGGRADAEDDRTPRPPADEPGT